MITMNFYSDGAYIKGHSIEKVCTLVSYAMWSCINDCLKKSDDVWHYQSANDEDEYWHTLGLTYIKVDKDNKELMAIYDNFRTNLKVWLEDYNKDDVMNRVDYMLHVKIIEKLNEEIEWKSAFKDAKKEQGYEVE